MKSKLKYLIIANLLILMCLSGCTADNGLTIEKPPFYSLQSAYNNKFISKADLKKIASLIESKGSMPLHEEKTNGIKESFIKTYPQDGTDISNVKIEKCFGSYNNSIAIMIGYDTTGNTEAIWSETISGVEISYIDGQRILIYKQN